MRRIPDPPPGLDPSVGRYLAELKRAVEASLFDLEQQGYLQLHSTASLPSAAGASRWIYVPEVGVPVFNDGSVWRHYGTATNTL